MPWAQQYKLMRTHLVSSDTNFERYKRKEQTVEKKMENQDTESKCEKEKEVAGNIAPAEGGGVTDSGVIPTQSNTPRTGDSGEIDTKSKVQADISKSSAVLATRK